MKRLILLAAVLALLLPTAATALAHPEEEHQEEESGRTGGLSEPETGSSLPDSPEYAFREDGTVVIDGDVSTDCSSFARAFKLEDNLQRNLRQARSVLEQCEEAGLLDSGDATSSASANSSASASASPHAPANGGEDELPDSGGPALLTLLGTSIFLLVTSGPLIRKVTR